MASHQRGISLSSDPQLLLEFMHELPDESESEDEFDGYLDPEDGPVVLCGSVHESEQFSSLTQACSLDSLTDTNQALESPLPPLPLWFSHASWRTMQPRPVLHAPGHHLAPHNQCYTLTKSNHIHK